MFILRVAKAFDHAKLPYAVIGGMAVALHGVNRGTMDLDLIIQLRLKDFELAEKTLLSMGFKSRLPITANEVYQFRKEFIEKRNLLAWSFFNPSAPYEIVDILLIEDLLNAEIELISVAGYKIKVVSIEDLIRIKLKSARDQDLEDIKMLKQLKSSGKKKSLK